MRKAGDSLLKAAYQAALAKEGQTPGALGSDSGLLRSLLAERGAAALGASDLRVLLNDAASPRKTAEMSAAERLGVVERYLQDSFVDMAPMVLPVQDRQGVYGASVIDCDRLIAYGLQRGNDENQSLLFAPAPVPGLTHVIEQSAEAGPVGTYAGAMSTNSARGVYGAAQADGFAKGFSDLLAEGWINGPDVSPGTGPIVQRLFQKMQQQQIAPNQRQVLLPFEIVASRGPGAQYDVLGMRAGSRTMRDARLPGEPGWLGNPYVADDAGGRYTRQEATDLFGQLVEQKAKDPAWRQAFLDLAGKRVGYYKPNEQYIHLQALQDWIRRNQGAAS